MIKSWAELVKDLHFSGYLCSDLHHITSEGWVILPCRINTQVGNHDQDLVLFRSRILIRHIENLPSKIQQCFVWSHWPNPYIQAQQDISQEGPAYPFSPLNIQIIKVEYLYQETALYHYKERKNSDSFVRVHLWYKCSHTLSLIQ